MMALCRNGLGSLVYVVFLGGMQDYNYNYAGCMELTLEVACCKVPLENTLQGYWNHNRLALVHFLNQANSGKGSERHKLCYWLFFSISVLQFQKVNTDTFMCI